MNDVKALPSSPNRRSAARGLVASLTFAAIALLAGCATPDQMPAGSTRAQVLDKFGKPLAVHPLPGGGERLEYQIGTYQQYAWMVDIDSSGRLTQVNQARTAENFGKLKVGVDTPETVVREFGTPWHIERYALSKLTAYLYPYREANFWNLMMAVHFDDAGVLRRVESGPDPRFIGGRDRRD